MKNRKKYLQPVYRWMPCLAILILGMLIDHKPGFSQEMDKKPIQSVNSSENNSPSALTPLAATEEEPLPVAPHPPISEVPPMPMPEPPDNWGQQSLAGQSLQDANTGIAYDIATGTTTLAPVNIEALTSPDGKSYGGGYCGPNGCGAKELLPASFFGNMGRIGTTGSDPWRMNVKLLMRFGSNWYVCSGTMRDAEVVLTAGHCVYDYGGTGWANEVYVYPGYAGGPLWGDASAEQGPYGGAAATLLGSFTGWTNYGNFDYDRGYIRLNRAVGMLTGWFGWSYGGDCTAPIYNSASYPAESCGGGLHNGNDMYYWVGKFDGCPSNQMQLNTTGGCLGAVWGGMSGSGAYEIIGEGGRYVQGVCSTSNRSTVGNYCRQTQDWVQWGNDSFIPDSRGNIFDIQALNMRLGDATIKAGTATTLLKHLATNPTEADPGNTQYNFKVYLSTNSYISTADTLLSSQFYNWDFWPMGSVTINMVNVTIPVLTPAGQYWLGVIYDKGTDMDDSNNATRGWDAVPITVTACDPPLAPSSIGYPLLDCDDGTFQVNWFVASGATSYILERDTNANFTHPTQIYSGTANWYNEANLPTGEYYYRVKSVNSCSASDWRTGGKIAVLDTITTAPASITYPAEDSDGTFNINWSAVAGASSYRLHRKKDLNETPIYIGPLTSYTEIGLAHGRYQYGVAARNACGIGPYVYGGTIQVGSSTTLAPILQLLLKE